MLQHVGPKTERSRTDSDSSIRICTCTHKHTNHLVVVVVAVASQPIQGTWSSSSAHAGNTQGWFKSFAGTNTAYSSRTCTCTQDKVYITHGSPHTYTHCKACSGHKGSSCRLAGREWRGRGRGRGSGRGRGRGRGCPALPCPPPCCCPPASLCLAFLLLPFPCSTLRLYL